jgi:hypothetical protein
MARTTRAATATAWCIGRTSHALTATSQLTERLLLGAMVAVGVGW